MENTLDSAAQEALRDKPAERNANSAATLKLVLLWLVVAIPMLWGAMKALEDVRSLLP